MSDTKINNQAKGVMGYKFPIWRAHCHRARESACALVSYLDRHHSFLTAADSVTDSSQHTQPLNNKSVQSQYRVSKR